mmetsp:Transcript_81628/g.195799  ORF Transcript_81628/g.195799 Transcript_81628/m.195799 type:complete len:107 (+) Transcript_81628:27-347(+)
MMWHAAHNIEHFERITRHGEFFPGTGVGLVIILTDCVQHTMNMPNNHTRANQNAKVISLSINLPFRPKAFMYLCPDRQVITTAKKSKMNQTVKPPNVAALTIPRPH